MPSKKKTVAKKKPAAKKKTSTSTKPVTTMKPAAKKTTGKRPAAKKTTSPSARAPARKGDLIVIDSSKVGSPAREGRGARGDPGPDQRELPGAVAGRASEPDRTGPRQCPGGTGFGPAASHPQLSSFPPVAPAAHPATRWTWIATTGPDGGCAAYGAYFVAKATSARSRSSTERHLARDPRRTDPPQLRPIVVVSVHLDLDRRMRADVDETLDLAAPLRFVVDAPVDHQPVSRLAHREHERDDVRIHRAEPSRCSRPSTRSAGGSPQRDPSHHRSGGPGVS
mgnify:CR=1 FL=1